MKIRITDTDKLQAAIDAVAGKAAAFIAGAADLHHASRRAEDVLEAKGLPVAQRNGAGLIHTPAGPDTSGYKYGAISIRTTMIRTSSGWWITGIERCKVYSKSRQKLNVRVTTAQADEIRARSTDGLTIVQEKAA